MNWQDEQKKVATGVTGKREWVGLTDEEVADLMEDVDHYNFPEDLIIYTQAKLREKNT
jgi:hypothetical protein